jgi:hypothetical protein
VGSIGCLRYCISHRALLRLRLRLAFSVVVYAVTSGTLAVDVARKAGGRLVVLSAVGESNNYPTMLNFTLPIPARLPSQTSLPIRSKRADPGIAIDVPAKKAVEQTMENFILG